MDLELMRHRELREKRLKEIRERHRPRGMPSPARFGIRTDEETGAASNAVETPSDAFQEQAICRVPLRTELEPVPKRDEEEQTGAIQAAGGGASGVKLIATSDCHGKLNGIHDEIAAYAPDIAVFAGDIAPSTPWEQEKFMQGEFCQLCKAHPNVEFVLIPGNHDFYAAEWQNAISYGKQPFGNTNLHFLCDTAETIRGIRFHGTPWCPYINGRWVYECRGAGDEHYRYGMIRECDVLIAHSPPFMGREAVDQSVLPDGRLTRHFGSIALALAIRQARPRLTICGHIHTGCHEPQTFIQTGGIVANVSRVNEEYNVAYRMTRFAL